MKGMLNLNMIIPVLFVAIVIIWEKFRQKNVRTQKQYDEMQLEIRGKGAWYGFYTLIVYWAVCSLAENVLDIHFLSASNAVFLGIMTGGSAMTGYSILHDSYYGMNMTGSRSIRFLSVIAVIEACAIVYLIMLILDGVFADLHIPCTDGRLLIVLCIPMFTTILVTTLIRRMRPEEGEE